MIASLFCNGCSTIAHHLVKEAAMSLIGRFFVLTILLAAAIVASCGSVPVDIRLGLEQGQTYRIRKVTGLKLKQTIQGREISANTTTTQDMSFEVTAVDSDGNMTVKVTFERVASEIESQGRVMSFDSDKPEQEPSSRFSDLEAMAGQSYTIVLSERGEPLGISGTDKIAHRILESLNDPDDSIRGQMKTRIEKFVEEQQTMDMCGQLFGMLPVAPVSEGEQWTTSLSTTVQGPLSWKRTCTLKEVRDDVFVIGTEAVTADSSGKEPIEMGPVRMFMDFDGTQSGTMELDKKTGLVVSGQLTSKVVGERRVEHSSEQHKSQSIPMEME